MSKRPQRPDDVNLLARAIVEQATGGPLTPTEPTPTPPTGKNPAAVELGRLGGLKGGKARAAKLSAEQRKAIAKKAAESRWSKSK